MLWWSWGNGFKLMIIRGQSINAIILGELRQPEKCRRRAAQPPHWTQSHWWASCSSAGPLAMAAQTRFLINIRKCDHHFSYTTIRLSQAGFAGMTTERDLCWEKREWPTAVHHSSKIFLKRYTYHTHTICLQFATFHSSNKKAFLFGQNGKILGPQKNGCTVWKHF